MLNQSKSKVPAYHLRIPGRTLALLSGEVAIGLLFAITAAPLHGPVPFITVVTLTILFAVETVDLASLHRAVQLHRHAVLTLPPTFRATCPRCRYDRSQGANVHHCSRYGVCFPSFDHYCLIFDAPIFSSNVAAFIRFHAWISALSAVMVTGCLLSLPSCPTSRQFILFTLALAHSCVFIAMGGLAVKYIIAARQGRTMWGTGADAGGPPV